jgi:hypothetical protein
MTGAARDCRMGRAGVTRGCMTPIDESPSNGAGELHAGDVVELLESHDLVEAGTRGRIVGFYAMEPREALLILEGGGQLRVPSPKLERVP